MTISMFRVLLRHLYRGISTCQRAWLFWTAALWHSAPCHRCRRRHPATAAEPQCRRAPPAPPPVHPPPAAASVRFSEPPAAQPLKPTACPRAAASHPQGRCGKSKLSLQKLAPSVRTITTRTPLAAISPRPEATALPRELQEKPAGGRSSHQPPARRRARRPLRYFSAFCTLSPCSQLPHGAASPQPCPPPLNPVQPHRRPPLRQQQPRVGAWHRPLPHHPATRRDGRRGKIVSAAVMGKPNEPATSADTPARMACQT